MLLHAYLATIAILHFCLYFIKTPTFVIPGLTISKVYGNTMLVILNNRIAKGRLRGDNLDVPRSPGGRNLNERCVFTVPSARPINRAGGPTIIVTNERLTFRFADSDIQASPFKQSDSDGRSSVHNTVYGHPFGSENDFPTTLPMTHLKN
jgi:hypothetical protein